MSTVDITSLNSPPLDDESVPLSNKEKDAAGRRAFKALVAPIRGRLLIARAMAVISGVLSVGPFIALVWLAQTMLKAWENGSIPDTHEVHRALVVLLSFFIAKLFFYVGALTVSHFADVRLRHHLQNHIASRMAQAPLSWFSQTNSGLVRKAIQDDTHEIHTVIAHAPVDNTVAIVSPLALLGYAFSINWKLGLLAIATLPLYLAAMAYMMHDMGEKTAEMDTHLGRVSATMVEFITGISVVKAFGRTGQAHERFTCATEDFHRFYYAWCGPMLRMSALSYATISTSVLVLANLGIGSLLVHSGQAHPSNLVVTTIIALMIPQSFETLANMTWALQLAGAAALRIQDVLTIPQVEELGETIGGEPHNHQIANEAEPPAVSFSHVSYSYGPTLALDSITLELAPGTVTALIGSSGSGKSTLATLLARFDDPDQGRITLDGKDLREFSTDELYKLVSFVLQDPHILRLSIRDNVRLGKTDATDEEIWQALEAAQIAEEIRALPRGLDTVFSTETYLSGGQCQRLSIARAILMDAPILILDEATALTDPESEALIQEALTQLVHSRREGRTVLVIAHRPASVRGVDQVVILDHGQVSCQGTPEQVAHHPLYSALWEGTD
ncbi:ABC transporter ATP-binding protein [Actinomyces vulturis]|uniref:ABC transporter ATP-binding protein n=1 Tax=Actinomyces vulturis TaxID=1857645 RepID=UPI00082A7471|nr:ABC transporter ATP-binding protein [Actinomyces vulturis]